MDLILFLLEILIEILLNEISRCLNLYGLVKDLKLLNVFKYEGKIEEIYFM